MNKIVLSVCTIWCLFSCSSKQVVLSNLIGKWEAEYLVRPNQDTVFYQAGSTSPCAYIILPFEYNSGFEITDEKNGELIWCGTNKGQFFTWSYSDKVMTCQFEDQTASVSMEHLTDSSMQITVSSGDRYHMKKY